MAIRKLETPSFEDILDEAPSEVDRPRPIPPGPYRCMILGQPRQDKSSKKQTPFTEFTAKPLEALKGVDEDALGEMGGLGERTLRVTFYHTPDSIYRLDEFLEHLGLELDGKTTRRMLLSETPGKEFIANVTHQMSDDGNTYARVSGTAAVE